MPSRQSVIRGDHFVTGPAQHLANDGPAYPIIVRNQNLHIQIL